MTPEQINAKELEFAEKDQAAKSREAALAVREAALKSAETKRVHDSHVEFSESLAGRVANDAQPIVVSLLDHLASMPEQIEFSDGDAKMPLIDAVKGMFSSLPERVAPGEMPKGGNVHAVDFSDPLAIKNQACIYQKKHADDTGQEISFAEAVQAVMAQAK
jgi:hypothetical protein